MKVPISEMYCAVQAEGKYRTPAVFIRFWGCNLRCGFNVEEGTQGRCDTPYAVFRGDKQLMEVNDIVQFINSSKINHIVFTGGEPTLYQKQIIEIVECCSYSLFVELETNGTIPITKECLKCVDQFNISVKLKSSKQWIGFDKLRINNEALLSFPSDKSTFKFVINSYNDIDEIQKITSINPNIRVTLMPQGETRKDILKNISSTLELCMKYKYGFSNRDHILAFDVKRGV